MVIHIKFSSFTHELTFIKRPQIIIETTSQIRTIKIIHASLCIGLTVALFRLGDLNNLKGFELKIPDLIYYSIPLIGYFFTNFLFIKKIKEINRNIEFKDALVPYQSASIIRWAILEGSAFCLLILKPELLVFNVLILVYLISLRPTVAKIKADLNRF